MKKILVIETHFDDAVIGCFGTLLVNRISNPDLQVFIFTVCYGRSTESNDNRDIIAKNIYKELNFDNNCNLNYPDLSLTTYHIDPIVKQVTNLIKFFKPDTLFIPESDLHPDHKIVNQACLIASRPTRDNIHLKEVLEYSVPSSSEWDFKAIKCNSGYKVIELYHNHVQEKLHYISAFKTEIKPDPDLRSINAHNTILKMNGYKFGYDYAELFNVIYSRD